MIPQVSSSFSYFCHSVAFVNNTGIGFRKQAVKLTGARWAFRHLKDDAALPSTANDLHGYSDSAIHIKRQLFLYMAGRDSSSRFINSGSIFQASPGQNSLLCRTDRSSP